MIKTIKALLALCLFLLVLSAFVSAEELPSAPALTNERIFAELGRLHLEVEAAREYVATLQTKIRELQAENASLKAHSSK